MPEATCPTALVINDDLSQLRLASALLEKEGLRTVACQSAEEALQVLHSGEIVDIILTDLHMPGIDGWRFCRLLRSPEYAAYNHIPVLVMSATFAGVEVERITTELGANAFLAIPYTPTTLRTCVRELLTGKTPHVPMRLLHIEDDPLQTTLLHNVFAAHGYRVYTATTGAEGLSLCQEYQPEMVILDYHLPDMTGDRLLTALVQPESPLVVLVTTADPTPELALQCMRLGATGYVRKPFDPAYLLDLCAKARRERVLLRVEDLLAERTSKLQQSEARFRALFNSIPDPVLVHDLQGRILHVNDASTQWLQRPEAALLGRHLCDLLAPHHTAQMLEHVQHAVTTGASRLQTFYVTRAGHTLTADVHKRRITFNGQTALLDVMRDTTERARLEAQLRQVQKLQAIGTLTGGIAHEFNNMLTVILGYTDLAMHHIPPADGTWRYLHEVLMAGQRARDLVQQLIAFSRHRMGERRPLMLHLLIDETLRMLQASLPETITLVTQVSPSVGMVLAEPAQIQQVVLHLCTNAVHAMRDTGGGLEVRLEAVEVAADLPVAHATLIPGSYVRLIVRDTGHGMPPEILERIFEPFFTTKEVGEGTGMGLAVVDGIVASHNGAVTVTSTPEHGSTFTIYLPRMSDAPAVTGEEPPVSRGC